MNGLDTYDNYSLLQMADDGCPLHGDHPTIRQEEEPHVDCTIHTLTKRPATPTEQISASLQDAYTYFNDDLFDDDLPECLITLQRHGRSYGYYCHHRFVNPDGERTDEIAVNPRFFIARTDKGVLSTLVHEMAHLWQAYFGKPGRGRYHNRQWANKMIALGLYPSNTGQPGGRETGDRMTHYIVEAGPFEQSCDCLIDAGFRLPWADNEGFLADVVPPSTPGVKGEPAGNRWKYTCPTCALNAWAKPAALLFCGACRLPMPHNLDRS